ncbi:predicted protein [Naegleria gruberi]|uniref:Predicted protein n=1 Tax=Naegleria gruberi TaxID=5762 RepID=D2VK08_NAEGR|nr:uncharacterized protein NAEGRDRAFT_69228 [Naegleria gruberi]EFC42865.1 predicted protein [Naegleria gruberi]|eukprot:XP_002675609.1 predicted protein [Naegleria gruberi strain NEG-M]
MEQFNQVLNKIENSELYGKVKKNEYYNKVVESTLASLIYKYSLLVIVQLKSLYGQLLEPVISGSKTYKEQLQYVWGLVQQLLLHYILVVIRQFQHGRQGLSSLAYEKVVQSKGASKLFWLDLGAQADLKEMASQCKDGELKNNFKKIYLVNTKACQSTLKSVEELGDLVEVITVEELQQVALQSKVDLVTISYSLTSVPNWIELLEKIKNELLSKNGVLAVTDYYVSRKSTKGAKQHNIITRVFWQTLLNLVFGLNVSADHLPYLEGHFDSVHVEENMGKIPLVSKLTLGRVKIPYYVYIAQLSK